MAAAPKATAGDNVFPRSPDGGCATDGTASSVFQLLVNHECFRFVNDAGGCGRGPGRWRPGAGLRGFSRAARGLPGLRVLSGAVRRSRPGAGSSRVFAIAPGWLGAGMVGVLSSCGSVRPIAACPARPARAISVPTGKERGSLSLFRRGFLTRTGPRFARKRSNPASGQCARPPPASPRSNARRRSARRNGRARDRSRCPGSPPPAPPPASGG